MKEAENRVPCGKRVAAAAAAAHGSGQEQEIKRTSPGNRRFAKQNGKKKKEKREKRKFARSYSKNIRRAFVEKSPRSFLFLSLSRSEPAEKSSDKANI